MHRLHLQEPCTPHDFAGCSAAATKGGGGGPAAGGAAAPPHAALCFLMTPVFGAIFAGSLFLILQVGADFFCQDGSQVWVKEKIAETRVGAFDIEPSRLLKKNL